MVEISHIPAPVRAAVREQLFLAANEGYLTDGLVAETRKAIFAQRGRAWDWEMHWAAHTYFCYAFNFAKNYYIAQEWLKGHTGTGPLKILDLGCGAGASSIGFATALLERNIPVTLLGVDSTPRMVEVFNATLPGMRAETADAGVYLAQDLSGWDLVLCSYLFCGDSKLRRDSLPKANRLVMDLMPTGETQIEIRGELFGFAFDEERRLDVSFLNGLLENERPQDVLPIVMPKARLQSMHRLRGLPRLS